MNDFETIRYSADGHVGTLTLARPHKHNAQNPLMWQELAQLGTQLHGDRTLRCLIVRGEGASFSSGIDLVEGLAGLVASWAGGPLDDDSLTAGRAAAETFSWIPALHCPSIAAVHGHAYGAGLQLALSCDFRVFADSAQVGLLETRYGILPDMGATVRLPRIVGEARARELILLGDIIDAGEAYRIGLANRLVPDAELDSAVTGMANRLASQPPVAVQGARRALDAAWHHNADDSLAVAIEEQATCIASDDFTEVIQALARGATPVWRGH